MPGYQGMKGRFQVPVALTIASAVAGVVIRGHLEQPSAGSRTLSTITGRTTGSSNRAS